MYEQLDTQIEINEDFLPNSNLTYDIIFNGNIFQAKLAKENFDRKLAGVEHAPKTIFYSLDKPLDQFTDEEKEEILSYRGLTLEDGFCAMDVFMEKSFVTCTGVLAEVTVTSTHVIKFADGESAQDFKEDRVADVYLHSYGKEGYMDKDDIGGDTKINFV